MKRVNRLGMIAVLAVGTVVAPAFAGNVTVGRFYTELAQAKQLKSTDAASAEANLRGAGFNLPQLALEKSMTQGDMTSISNAIGVAVTTQRPGESINESQFNTYMASFGGQISSAAVGAGKLGEGDSGNSVDAIDNHFRHHRHEHDHHHDHHHSTCHP
jgi:hypothetical protein